MSLPETMQAVVNKVAGGNLVYSAVETSVPAVEGASLCLCLSAHCPAAGRCWLLALLLTGR